MAAVLSNDGQGIGLFRSEFLYLASSDYPTEEEQLQAYKTVAAAMDGKRVVIRTLDIPAVLRALKMAADAAHKAGIWIGICGELGADLSMLETFLAIGIDELSVSPSSVLPLRAEIRKSIAKTCILEKLEC